MFTKNVNAKMTMSRLRGCPAVRYRNGCRRAPAPCYVISMSADSVVFEPLTTRLRDGSQVTVRAIRAEDADKLQAAIRALSVESRYSRFFSPLRELPPELLERATHPDAKRELQLVAVVASDSKEVIVGGARYAAAATDGDCEFAVAVVDEWHGRGLARLLLETLMRAAHAHGFARMEGYILATNAAMLGLANRLGFTTLESPEGPTVRLVRRDLGVAPAGGE
jgi:GNAT superfamily N-acetyltransferase